MRNCIIFIRPTLKNTFNIKGPYSYNKVSDFFETIKYIGRVTHIRLTYGLKAHAVQNIKIIRSISQDC